jgi:hypothetical protein
MWIALNAKFNRTSEVLKGLAMENLRALKLANGRDLPAHLEAFEKLRSEATRVGCRLMDTDVIPIILQSLPATEFGQSIIALQSLTITVEVISSLRQYWDIVYKKDVEAGDTGVASALATNFSGGSKCGNCAVNGHSKDSCWSSGGGREGQAPDWWVAPPGKEPRPHLVEAFRAKHAAKRQAKQAAAATAAARGIAFPWICDELD